MIGFFKCNISSWSVNQGVRESHGPHSNCFIQNIVINEMLKTKISCRNIFAFQHRTKIITVFLFNDKHFVLGYCKPSEN